MSDPQRTHKASPKRVQDFRKKGDIALSRDAVSTIALLGAAIGLFANAGRALEALKELVRLATRTADGTSAADLPRQAVSAFFAATGPVLAGAALGAIVAIAGQLGWPPAWKGIHFDLGKLNPGTNIINTWGLAGMAKRTGMAIAKVAVVGAIVVAAVGGDMLSHPIRANEIVAVASGTVGRVLISVVAALVAIAAVDYLLARRRIAKQMMMTGEEMKREHRESDGDPHVKGRRRQRARQLAKRRMAKAVASADVVVVNPTHYSVALRYEENSDRAPIVVAKGVDEAAAKIREIARKHGVPILSRPPLARALHKHVKEDQPIPANLYKAVAEVLAYVYRLKAR